MGNKSTTQEEDNSTLPPPPPPPAPYLGYAHWQTYGYYNPIITPQEAARRLAPRLASTSATLSLADSNYSTLPQLTNADILHELDISGNGITEWPEGSCPLLQCLRAQRCKLLAVPPVLFSMQLLYEVDLSHNRLDQIPAAIAQLVHLNTLLLNNNNLTDDLPTEMGNMHQLKVLTWRENPLEEAWDKAGVVTTKHALARIRTRATIPAPVMPNLTTEEKDTVWFCGKDIRNETVETTPQPLGPLFDGKSILQVACSESHSVFLTDTGEVWAVGSNNYGQLGLGHNAACALPKYVEALSGKRIIAVSCGFEFTLALDDNRNVYSWGRGKDGRLGNGSDHNHYSPIIIPALSAVRAVHISCGSAHSLVLDTYGRVYSWGSVSLGRLGRQVTETSPASIPYLITSFPEGTRISRIATGSVSSYALSFGDNTLWAWGNNSHVSLTLPSGYNSNVPTAVEWPKGTGMETSIRIEDIVASGNNVLLKTESGIHSMGAMRKLPSPTLKFEQIACSPKSFFALSSEGKVFAWGENIYGQLGLGSTQAQEHPVEITHPVEVQRPKFNNVYRLGCSRATTIFVIGVPRHQLGESYKSLLGQQMCSDVVFKFQDGTAIFAHKIVVDLRCPKLAGKYFSERMDNSNACAVAHDGIPLARDTQTIVMEELSASLFYVMLTYLYTDRADLGEHSTEDRARLEKFATEYGLARLASIIQYDSIVLAESTFYDDLARGVNNPMYSDVVFEAQDDGSGGVDMEGDVGTQEKGKEKEGSGNDVGSVHRMYGSKALLCARSEYFAARFLGAGKDMKDGSNPVVTFPEPISREALHTLFRFLYTDQLAQRDDQVSPDVCISLLSVANMYQLERLRDICMSEVQKALEPESVAFVWHIAQTAGAAVLVGHCLDMIATHTEEVMASEAFGSLPAEAQDVLKTFVNWDSSKQ
eukprot:TRINITY_DN5492_c1_g1_i3.p1 TRINITY_DN5492_c1_g1~~TRINITY_DN5492_c1_g1_i3.p1  ORF type:complete len:941 (+),score=172.97 TRINITY_DN5492_c1_g1_i3:36-2825(+)